MRSFLVIFVDTLDLLYARLYTNEVVRGNWKRKYNKRQAGKILNNTKSQNSFLMLSYTYIEQVTYVCSKKHYNDLTWELHFLEGDNVELYAIWIVFSPLHVKIYIRLNDLNTIRFIPNRTIVKFFSAVQRQSINQSWLV